MTKEILTQEHYIDLQAKLEVNISLVGRLKSMVGNLQKELFKYQDMAGYYNNLYERYKGLYKQDTKEEVKITKEVEYVSFPEEKYSNLPINFLRDYVIGCKIIFCKTETELHDKDVEAINEFTKYNTVELDVDSRDSGKYWVMLEKEVSDA